MVNDKITSKDEYVLSIVVSAFSMERYEDLVEIFNKLNDQICLNFELIIIIDENFNLYDKLKLNFKNYNFENLFLIFNKNNYGLSYSRNLGIQKASGNAIAFLDDDAVPVPEWTQEIVKTFNDGKVMAATGDVIPLWEDPSMAWFPKELNWLISCSYIMTPSIYTEIDRGFGVNMVFRKDVFDEIGVFNTNLGISKGRWIGGEDTDMFLRVQDMKGLIIFNPNITVYHKIAKKRIYLINICKRAYNGGISVAALKSTRPYRMNKSTEYKYFFKLLYDFYPNSIIQALKKPSIEVIKKIVYVSFVILFHQIGYLHGSIKFKFKDIR